MVRFMALTMRVPHHPTADNVHENSKARIKELKNQSSITQAMSSVPQDFNSLNQLDVLAAQFVIPKRKAALPILRDPVIVYTIPDKEHVTTKTMFIRLLSCLFAAKGRRIADWKKLTYTYLLNFIEGYTSDLKIQSAAIIEPLPEDALVPLREAGKNPRPIEMMNAVNALASYIIPRLVRPEDKVVASAFKDVAEAKIIAVMISLVIWCGLKVVTADNRNSITVNRPAAIIRKYQLGGYTDGASDVPTISLLNGPMRISDDGHECINMALIETTALRIAFFELFIPDVTSAIDTSYDVIMTTMNLLRNTGQTHVLLARDLVVQHPWVRGWQPVAVEIATLFADARSFSTFNRDMAPWARAVYGDYFTLFRRKDLAGLAEISLSLKRLAGNSTIQNYYSDPTKQALVQLFMMELELQKAKKDKKDGTSAPASSTNPPAVTAPPVPLKATATQRTAASEEARKAAAAHRARQLKADEELGLELDAQEAAALEASRVQSGIDMQDDLASPGASSSAAN